MNPVGLALEQAVEQQQGLRDADLVMAPARLGAARLTRYSFSRMVLRRAFADAWRPRRARFEIDAQGRGEAIYEVSVGSLVFSFVVFSTTLDESEHTDRVVANNWEITGALVEGVVDDACLDFLREQVPEQENGRLDPRVLVLTRGNRSVRFFQYLVDCLARGEQPLATEVGDAGYIMRSTAFYGNGKYGMRSFEGYEHSHPLSVPYRAQFLAAWLFREFSYDVVESCAEKKGGDDSVVFDPSWQRFFGLGNATGLGLVPYALKHPRVIHAWVAVRELALAEVRDLDGTDEELDLFAFWINRARAFFATGTAEDCSPFLSPQQLVEVIDEVRIGFDAVRVGPRPFDELYVWAESKSVELTELVVALLLELHEGDDHRVDEFLRVNESEHIDPAMTAGELADLASRRFAWIKGLDLGRDEADHFWWLISDNTEEPRRAPRSHLEPEGRDVAIDIALRVWRLREALQDVDSTSLVAELLTAQPEHRIAVQRVLVSDVAYGEPRDNVCDSAYLPLQLQRFQLAMYGMDNFKPKSTDWLRVTLFQGAPRLADLAGGVVMQDRWALPPQPTQLHIQGEIK